MTHEETEERFLAEIAAYLETHEPLPPLDEGLEREFDRALADDTVLSPVDALAAASDASTSSASTPKPATTTTGKASSPTRRRPKRSRNLARERLQSELRELRAQSTDLERQVAELKKRRTFSPGEQLLLAAYKQIATHQRTQRREAELENLRLKAALQLEKALALELRQSAQSLVARSAALDEALLVRSQVPHLPCTDAQDAALFSALVREADAAYVHTDAVLQRSGLRERQLTAAGGPSQPRRRTITSLDGSLAIELTSTKEYSFAIDVVFKATWECWEKQYAASGYVLFDLEPDQPRHTVAGRFEIPISVDGETVMLTSMTVLRMYRDREGFIRYVWRAKSQATSHFPGVYVDEVGWEQLGPTSDGGSVMLSCSHLRCKADPDDTRAAGDRLVATDADAVPLATLLAAAYEADVDRVNSRIEGLLLEDSAHK